MSASGERVRELTPHGLGAVSVIELVGPGAFERAKVCAPSLRAAVDEPQLVRLESGGDELDTALALVEREGRVELHLHGNPRVVERALGALWAAPQMPQAQTLEQRALQLLASAATEAGARVLLDQAQGALRSEIESIAAAPLDVALARCERLLAASRAAQFALHARRVVLAGPVNAGKSTLFNALYGAQRVIVSSQAGTTRDAVRERIVLGDWPIDLFDMAGERDAADEVESEGQAAGRELRARADLTLWLTPAQGELPKPVPGERVRTLVTHAEHALDEWADPPRIGALHDPEHALRVVRRSYERAFDLPPNAWVAGAPAAFDGESLAIVERALAELRAGRDGRRVLPELLSAPSESRVAGCSIAL